MLGGGTSGTSKIWPCGPLGAVKLLEKTELKSDSVVGRRATFKHSNSRWNGLVVRGDLSGTQRLNLTVVDDSVFNSTDVDDVETHEDIANCTMLCNATTLVDYRPYKDIADICKRLNLTYAQVFDPVMKKELRPFEPQCDRDLSALPLNSPLLAW